MGKFQNNHLIKMPKKVDDYKKEILKRNLSDIKVSSNMANYLKNILVTVGSNQIGKDEIKSIASDLFSAMMKMQNHYAESTDYYIKGAIMLEGENLQEVCKLTTIPRVSITGESIESQDIYITPERYLEQISNDVIEIVPEQLMLFRTAERAFEFSSENVEFMTLEKYQAIADKLNAN
jgi:hypothetical protein